MDLDSAKIVQALGMLADAVDRATRVLEGLQDEAREIRRGLGDGVRDGGRGREELLKALHGAKQGRRDGVRLEGPEVTFVQLCSAQRPGSVPVWSFERCELPKGHAGEHRTSRGSAGRFVERWPNDDAQPVARGADVCRCGAEFAGDAPFDEFPDLSRECGTCGTVNPPVMFPPVCGEPSPEPDLATGQHLRCEKAKDHTGHHGSGLIGWPVRTPAEGR